MMRRGSVIATAAVKPNTACGAAKPATVHSPSRVNSCGRWPAKSSEGNDTPAEGRRELLEARREVHRRADAGEIQPVAAADIAVEHLAQMQRQTEADAPRSPAALERLDVCAALRAPRRARVRRPRRRRRRPVAGKDRQQPVAHEFQHLAAVLEDRGHLAVEIAVEQIDQSPAAAGRPAR